MKLPKGVFQRNKSSPQLWISYINEEGKRIKEAAGTTDPELAVRVRNQKLALVEEHRLIPTRKFESITVGEIIDFWWERHAKHRNNKFEYLLFRLKRFRPMKARKLSPEMVQDFLSELTEVEKLSPASSTTIGQFLTRRSTLRCGGRSTTTTRSHRSRRFPNVSRETDS